MKEKSMKICNTDDSVAFMDFMRAEELYKFLFFFVFTSY